MYLDCDKNNTNIQRFYHSSSIWFSNLEDRFDLSAQKIGRDNFGYLLYQFVIPRKVRRWHARNKSQKAGFQISDYPNCFVSAAKAGNGKIRFSIRRNRLIYSRYREHVCRLIYVIEFETGQIGDLKEGMYYEPYDDLHHRYGLVQYPRWYINLGENRYIWQWQKKGGIKENSELAKIHESLIKIKEQPSIPTKSNTCNSINIHSQYDGPSIIPVIYQLVDDTNKNFLREIHCYPMHNQRIQITLIFNNEHLVYHNFPLVDPIYRLYRLFKYGRVTDIESFEIKLADGIPKKFQFTKIFSGKHTADDDNIHLDTEGKHVRPVIHHYFNEKLPIVFVNTANHAMSNRDANFGLWKCEYLPWEEDCAAMLGNMSKEQIGSGASKLTNLMTEKKVQKRRTYHR